MKVFLLHVRYIGAFVIVFIGSLLCLPGEALVKLGKWIGSRDKRLDGDKNA